MMKTRLLECTLAALAMANCLAIWYLLLRSENVAPIMIVYLTEIAGVGLAGFLFVFRDTPPASSMWGIASWAMGGILLGFSFTGGFSIGPLLLPATISMGVAAALADRRRRRQVPFGILTLMLAAIVQAAVMIGIMRLR